jgi:hypothetical protein
MTSCETRWLPLRLLLIGQETFYLSQPSERLSQHIGEWEWASIVADAFEGRLPRVLIELRNQNTTNRSKVDQQWADEWTKIDRKWTNIVSQRMKIIDLKWTNGEPKGWSAVLETALGSWRNPVPRGHWKWTNGEPKNVKNKYRNKRTNGEPKNE